MGPIQKIPPGFMSLLGLKQLGKLPGILNDVVSGVVDLREWYMQADRIGTLGLSQRAKPAFAFPLSTSFNSPGTKSFGNSVVPAGEFWYIDHYSIRCTGTATTADTWSVTPLLQTPAGENIAIGPTSVDTVSALANRQTISYIPRPVWAPPGTILGFHVGNVNTATAITAVLDLLAVPLPI